MPRMNPMPATRTGPSANAATTATVWAVSEMWVKSNVPPRGRPSPATVVPSAVFALPRMPAQITPMHIEIARDAVLLVGTDGFGDPLDDGMGEVGDVFAHALTAPPPPLGLAHLLDFSRETFDDDRTLLAIWPMRGR